MSPPPSLERFQKNHPFWYPDPSLTLPPSKKAERVVWIALPHPTWITRDYEGIFLKEKQGEHFLNFLNEEDDFKTVAYLRVFHDAINKLSK